MGIIAYASSEQKNKKFHGFLAFGLFLFLMFQKCYAAVFMVGGSKGWGVPMDSNGQSYNQWAEANRFQIGDSLVFNYGGDEDSVLQVSEDDYNNCFTDSPIQKHSDGHTIFQFNQSGPYYFISGNKNNCLKNEKLVVIVLANRTNSITPPPLSPPIAAAAAPPELAPSLAPSSNNQLAPTPSNSAEMIPSPAPNTDIASPPPEIIPSPPLIGEESPSPPPPSTVEITPTPAPISEPPPFPPSVGSHIIPSCIIGSIEALIVVAALI